MVTYAADISPDGLELFFTQENPDGGVPTIYRSVRGATNRAFGRPRPISAITGYAEAPSISADGTTLYYHRLVGSVFEIWEVTRR
jgi:Tol biopolymer transport system component